MADTSRMAMAKQYGDDRNLAARQALYRFRRPAPDLWDWALGLADLGGDERVVDVGCGNGNYLASLLRGRGHRGPVAGFDLSPGMAALARERSGAPVAVADMQALPLRTDAVDVALCMHVLYHAPDQGTAVAELRRIVAPGGRVLVLTNGGEAMHELSELVTDVAGSPPNRAMLAFKVEDGDRVLGPAFDAVELHELRSAVDVTEADAVVAYVRSARDGLYLVSDEDLVEIGRRVQAVIDADGAFSITTVIGCFVCR